MSFSRRPITNNLVIALSHHRSFSFKVTHTNKNTMVRTLLNLPFPCTFSLFRSFVGLSCSTIQFSCFLHHDSCFCVFFSSFLFVLHKKLFHFFPVPLHDFLCLSVFSDFYALHNNKMEQCYTILCATCFIGMSYSE